MYKLVAIDMDGTLLSHSNRISAESIAAINEARKKGVRVVISTGRAFGGVKMFLGKLGIESEEEYSVTYSGAYVTNNTQSRVLNEEYMSFEDVKEVYSFAESRGIHLNMYTSDSVITFSNNYTTKIDEIANQLQRRVLDFSQLDSSVKIFKIILINEDERIKDEIMNAYPRVPVDSIEFSINDKFERELFFNLSRFPESFHDKYALLKLTPYHVEILPRQTNKASGLMRLAETLGIRREEILSIGDSGNDKQMIQYAGMGIAMGNASDEIKSIADYITLSVEENGVAHAINKFVL